MIDRFILKLRKQKSTDRLTHMQYESTHLEEVSKTGRHTYSVRRHSQQKCFKEVDSLEGCVDTIVNIQTYQVNTTAYCANLLQDKER